MQEMDIYDAVDHKYLAYTMAHRDYLDVYVATGGYSGWYVKPVGNRCDFYKGTGGNAVINGNPQLAYGMVNGHRVLIYDKDGKYVAYGMIR